MTKNIRFKCPTPHITGGAFMPETDMKHETVMNPMIRDAFVRILKDELIPSMGCTEPVSLALAAARARDVLGMSPERAVVKASGSIIKNARSVSVPHTGGLRGIPAAVAAGIAGGKAELALEVLSCIVPEQVEEARRLLETLPIDVKLMETGHVFDLEVELFSGGSRASVRITDRHTHFAYIEKDGKAFLDDRGTETMTHEDAWGLLNMERIWAFSREVPIEDVEMLINRQVAYNRAIAEEGLSGDYGANVGKVLRDSYGNDIRSYACSMAAAGSDARMNGCEMPVIINSGSGNQGLTVCLPVVCYAERNGISGERLIRALVLANLTAIYEKTGIGTLSAYCGAVSAGAAAAAGIAYLLEDSYKAVIHTVVNALAVASGIICDGAKASCAGKIAISVYNGILGYEMYRRGQQFVAGDGIVVKGIDENVKAVGELASQGMSQTNQEIIRQILKMGQKNQI